MLQAIRVSIYSEMFFDMIMLRSGTCIPSLTAPSCLDVSTSILEELCISDTQSPIDKMGWFII